MNDKIFDITGKNIILTGSAGFLGTHFSHLLSSRGANVILVDVEKSKNKKLEFELCKKYNTLSKAFNFDISNPKEIKKSIKEIKKQFNTIDVLINNAQFLPKKEQKRDASFENYPFELWNKSITTNLNGVFLMSREIGNIMLRQKYGNMINISSIYGIRAPDQRIYGKTRLNSPAFYSVTKGGTVSLTRYLASLWGKENVRVNSLTLGGVYNKKTHTKSFVKSYSQRTMINRMGKISDYDGALLFLVSDASSYMTGSNMIVDGGLSSW